MHLEEEVCFKKLNNKGKKVLLSIRPRYIWFCEHYASGGCGYSEFYKEHRVEYEEYVRELYESMKTEDILDLVVEFNISLVEYWDAKVIYPVQEEDVKAVNGMLQRLKRLKRL